MKNARFYFQPVMQIIAFICFFSGGAWLWLPGAVIFLGICMMDEVFEDTPDGVDRVPLAELPLILTAMFAVVNWLTFLLVINGSFASGVFALDAWGVSAPGFAAQPYWAVAGAVFSMGILGVSVCNVAHDYVHRLHNRFYVNLGQALFCFAAHTSLRVEHVFGHHKNACCHDDPASARRGESFWHYLPRSVWGTYRNAYRFERERLARRGQPVLSIHNRALRGYAMQFSFYLVSFCLAGLPGVVLTVIANVISMLVTEQFQYLSHYGLARARGTPQKLHHAWNFKGAATLSFTFNVTRHGGHHIAPNAPYHALKRTCETVTYPFGAHVMLVAILVPPLFKRLVAGELTRWDEMFASDDERHLAATANG